MKRKCFWCIPAIETVKCEKPCHDGNRFMVVCGKFSGVGSDLQSSRVGHIRSTLIGQANQHAL